MLADLMNGKDFKMANGSYISIRDLKTMKVTSILVRYDRLRKTDYINIADITIGADDDDND